MIRYPGVRRRRVTVVGPRVVPTPKKKKEVGN